MHSSFENNKCRFSKSFIEIMFSTVRTYMKIQPLVRYFNFLFFSLEKALKQKAETTACLLPFVQGYCPSTHFHLAQ